MSPTQDYYDWVKNGEHWYAARPVNDMQKTLEGLGYTVYVIGDQNHLRADPPEDHTPFSRTGYPVSTPKGVVTAFDVMPKNGNMADLAHLGRLIVAAREAGLTQASFIKYINWTDENGNVFHYSWEPGESKSHSSDAGHIHVSVYSNMIDSDVASGWNPLSGDPFPPQPKPRPKPGQPAPGNPIDFPLPVGYYFGYPSGPVESVSGQYGRIFKGLADHEWLKKWADQLSLRGWSIGVGKTYLSTYGNDGRYGDEYNKLVKAFQEDQGLSVDGELGINTWTAAYHNPVN
jgi:peptidoglycan hydrolase-like protein with peptidoglycan-binding domain